MIDFILSTIENEEQRSELAEFYSKYKNRLYAIALSRLHNAQEAEDAVQDVFSRIADKPEKFFDIPPENRLAYVDVIVRNVAIDMFNGKNKVPVEPLEENIPDENVSLENGLFGRISRDEILKFVDGLPTAQREVLMLHCFFGLSIDDTAQRLNISLDAAKKRLMLARKAIRGFLDERSGRHE